MSYENPYTPPSLSGFNSSPPSDDGAQTVANQLKWSTHLAKIGTPLRSFAEDISAAVLTAFGLLPERLGIIGASKASASNLTSQTLANDADLAIDVDANTIYAYELYLRVSFADGDNGFRRNWTGPAGASGHGHRLHTTPATPTTLNSNNIAAVLGGADITVANASGANTMIYRETGQITIGSTAGTFQLQVAQENGNAGLPTTISAGSWLRLQRVSA